MSNRDEIVRLVGDVDEMTISAIVETGASLAEIEQAARWAAGDAVARAERHEMSGRAAAVYDLLIGDPVFAAAADTDRPG